MFLNIDKNIATVDLVALGETIAFHDQRAANPANDDEFIDALDRIVELTRLRESIRTLSGSPRIDDHGSTRPQRPVDKCIKYRRA